ncbi:Conserved hypothetical protein [Clostridium neonatale]|uniref:DNA/RNA non-specific endonuclease n=1 Tax=Clostridium neonatale TaxID=137838 RepID=UPI00291BF98D|nr:DNA/RNA non-specific endonuclease [Clostridium neonatale]CAI3216804.1 Conserved hypothetical protein [Clostridium neonatale]
MKLHLDIDKDQGESEAAWFKYAPPTGNTMYSMPIVGTSAKLYFSDETCNEPLVSGCVRNNGSSCEKTADTTKRYFGTEHGSEVEMTPSALNIKGGSKSPISISIDDNVGITITSPKKLNLSADSEIIMKTPKNVKINGVSQINAQKTNTESGFSLETDLHFLSEKVIKNGSSSESYEDFDDEPEAGKKPGPEKPKEKKKGFSWGKLALAAVATVAIVASIFTFGATATVAAIALGAIAASAAVGAYNGAKNSIDSQKSANKEVDYLEVVKSGFRGAVTGATDMVKTELCSAADWTAQTFLGTVSLLNEASKYLPFTRNNTSYQISADQTSQMLNNASNYVHQFFKDLAPYKNAYEYGEYVLNVATIANGIKSIGNISQKGMGGISIGNMQIANTNMVVPVLSYSGEAIVGVKEAASIAIAGGSIYNMSNSNSGAGDKSLNEDLIDDDKGGGGKTKVNYGEQFTKGKNGRKELKPEIEYTDSNGYTYETDASGNIVHAHTDNLAIGKGKRNPYAQRKVGGKDRLPTDDGGHLFGNQFKGSGDIDNLLPQDAKINRSSGEWYNMEREWAKAKANKSTVKVDIVPQFNGSSRPTRYIVKYWIDGKKTIKIIDN